MSAGSASSTLATWRGRRVLILLCAVAFLDFVDVSAFTRRDTHPRVT